MKPSRWIALVVILAIAWIFRPVLHGPVMLIVSKPLVPVFTLICLLIFLRFFKRLKNQIFRNEPPAEGKQTNIHRNQTGCWSLGIFFFLAFVILPTLGALNGSIRSSVIAKSITYEPRTDLPQFQPIRLTPEAVATRYAEDTFQNPQEYLGNSRIAMIDGKLQRVFPRLPDGALLYFLKKLSGFVVVDVDTLERKVTIDNQEFVYSEGVGIFDNLYYRLPFVSYFSDYGEPVYLKDDQDEWVTVVPLIKYRGFPFTVPYWGGDIVIKSDGTMTAYTAEQAQQLSYVKDNRVYPKELVEQYTHAYAYKNGLINNWFVHKDQTSVTEYSPGEDVFHVATTEGFKQMVVAEPSGRSYGIYKILIIDATTGKREIVEFDQSTQLTGPIVAADYVKKEFPTYDWSAFFLSEPRPVIVNDNLNWLFSIIPNDSAGIAASVFLDAKTNEVTKTDSQSQIDAFLAGQAVTSSDLTTPTTVTDQINEKIQSIETELTKLKELLKTIK